MHRGAVTAARSVFSLDAPIGRAAGKPGHCLGRLGRSRPGDTFSPPGFQRAGTARDPHVLRFSVAQRSARIGFAADPDGVFGVEGWHLSNFVPLGGAIEVLAVAQADKSGRLSGAAAVHCPWHWDMGRWSHGALQSSVV